MGGQRGGGAAAGGAGKALAGKDGAMNAAKMGAGKSGIAALLADKKKMAGVADGLGMMAGQMAPEAAPPPSMVPMDMGGGAAMTNGDPSALMALAQRRPDIFARIGRFGGGGY